MLFGRQAHRDAATIVLDGRTAVGVQSDLYLLAETGQGFVGGVVDNFLKDVQGIVGTGIHARPLPHRLQSLQNADGCFVVTWYSPFFLEFCKWTGGYFTDNAFCMGKEDRKSTRLKPSH